MKNSEMLNIMITLGKVNKENLYYIAPEVMDNSYFNIKRYYDRFGNKFRGCKNNKSYELDSLCNLLISFMERKYDENIENKVYTFLEFILDLFIDKRYYGKILGEIREFVDFDKKGKFYKMTYYPNLGSKLRINGKDYTLDLIADVTSSGIKKTWALMNGRYIEHKDIICIERHINNKEIAIIKLSGNKTLDREALKEDKDKIKLIMASLDLK